MILNSIFNARSVNVDKRAGLLREVSHLSLARVRRAALVLGMSGALTIGASAMAQTITIDPTWDGTNNNQAGAYLLNDGSTVTMNGNFTFAPTNSISTRVVLVDLLAGNPALIDDGGVGDLATRIRYMALPQTYAITVPDTVTGGSKTYNVYASSGLSGLADCTWAECAGQVPQAVLIYQSGASANIYNDVRLATVSNGTLNYSALTDFTVAGFKNTALLQATGTGSIVLQRNINFGSLGAADIRLDPAAATSPQNYTVSAFTYNGSITAFDSSVHNVTDVASFQAYNDWLIGKLQAGALSTSAYNTEYAKAYTLTPYDIQYDPLGGVTIDSSDPIFAPIGKIVLAEADGSGATVRNATGFTLRSTAGNSRIATDINAVLHATNGGTVINDGLIVGYNIYGVVGMRADAGGHAINNGVRIIGYNGTLAGNASAAGLVAYESDSRDFVTGAGSTYLSNGIINLAGYDATSTIRASMALRIEAGGSATNAGTINVGVKTSTAGGTLYGAQVDGVGSTFTNAATGVIYLGREASADTTLAPIDRGGPDTSHGGQIVGVYAAYDATAANEGTIVIGTKLGLVTAMYAAAVGSNSAVVNAATGVININGTNADAGQNIGMRAAGTLGASNNAGVINLNGVNAVGVTATSGGKIGSSGTINILAGSDPASGLRNYGMWIEGTDSVGTLSGTINLAGDGAIGVHARSRGVIDITGAGQVVFASGTQQIGYFVYGAGSAINNSGTGAQDVTTANSVLFRMEAGADFTGGVGAASTLTASGANSTAVVVTGRASTTDVSAFNSGGMTINATGEDATAVVVEGGAQGRIASTAVITLTGAGAVAGIADGQKHNLDGTNSGSAIAGALVAGTTADAGAGATFGTGTILVSGANLNSSLNDVTGYIARNRASLDNAGNIVFSGTGATGILVAAGATGGNSGSITIGAGGRGIVAEDSTGTLVTTVNTSGNLVLNGGSVTSRTIGISASGAKTTVNMTDGTISMNGNGAIGVQALNSAKVNLSGTASASFGAGFTDQILFHLSGAGAAINATSSTVLDASGVRSTLYRLDSGAVMNGVVQIAASGQDARGIYANGTGTAVTVASGSELTLSGNGASGLYVAGGAQATLAAGATVLMTGTGAIAGIVDGNSYDIDGVTVIGTNTGSKLTNAATMTSAQPSATGFVAQNAGLLVNSGPITFTGANSQAIKVLSASLTNTGNITANGVAVYVEGASSTITNNGGTILASDGTAAIRLGTGASLNLVGSGVSTVEGRGMAHAVLVDTGAAGLNVNGAHLVVNAASASGNGIENKANLAGITLTGTTIDVADGVGVRTSVAMSSTNSGTINVTGGGAGLGFQTLSGGAVPLAAVNLSGSNGLTVNVSGTGGRGVVANLSTAGSTVTTAVNVNVTAADGGAALWLGNGVATATNSGSLVSASASDATVYTNKVTNFTNTSTGVITASGTGGALLFDTQATTLTNAGKINGLVDLNNGANVFANNATGVIVGNVLAGTGNDGFTNAGAITGQVDMGAGNNTYVATGIVTGNVLASGAGTNAVTLTGGKVTGAVDLSAASGANTVLLQTAAALGSFAGGTGADTVTVKGNGNTFGALNGGAGTDTLVFDAVTAFNGAQNVLNAASVTNFEQVNLRNTSTVTLNAVLGAGATPGIDVDTASTLAIAPAAAYTLANKLTGTGLVTVNTGANNAFNFAATTGTAFAGTMAMGPGTFLLNGASNANAAALTNATLRADTGSVTAVQSASTIGKLTFNGGAVAFNGSAPDQTVATGLLTVGTLTASGSGTVAITIPSPYVVPAGTIPAGSVSLLAQDDATNGIQLVKATTLVGTGGSLALVDQNGNAVGTTQNVNLSQGGNTVAIASYGYGLTAGSGAGGNGLYVGYKLTQVNLQAGRTLTLSENAGATGTAADLSAKVIGSGNLTIASAGTVSLSNGANSYTGATTVSSGTLRLDNNNVLGATSALNIANAATVNVNGKTQTVGAFDGDTGSTLNLAGGALTIANGGVSDGALSGAGTLKLNGGSLAVNGANAGLSAATTIALGATAVLTNTQGLGTGAITDTGTLVLNGASGTLANAISGAGAVNLTNAANVAVTGGNTGFAGTFNVNSVTTLTATAQSQLGTAVIVDNGTTVLKGYTGTLANVISGSGVVDLTTAANVTLTGNNAAFAGTFRVNSGNTLTASAQNQLGTAAIVDNGTTVLKGYSGTLANNVSGNGTLSLTNAANVTLTGNNATFTGTHNIAIGTTLHATAQSQLGTSAARIVANGTFDLSPNAAFTLINGLTGTGLMTVKTGVGNAFDFAASAGTAFAGTMAMGAGTFLLDGTNNQNAAALTNATLRADANSVTTVQSASTIGNLAFNGGTVAFNAAAPADQVAEGLLTVGALNIGGVGTVRINVPNPYDAAIPTPATELSLLAQDDVHEGLQLVAASSVTGTGANLTLVDQNGTAVSAAQSVNIGQGGSTVAIGTYDYGVGSGTNTDGLYVGYRLSELNLQDGETLVLAEVAGATGNAADLSAKLTGAGNLEIAATDIVSLSNAANDFTGTALVSSGTLQAGVANVIASSSAVTVNATFDANGFDQTLNNLSGDTNGRVILGTGVDAITLTLNSTADTVFAGAMSGNAADEIGGSIVKTGDGMVDLTGLVRITGVTVEAGMIGFGPDTQIEGVDTVVMNGGTARFMGGSISASGNAVVGAAGVSTVELTGVSVQAAEHLFHVLDDANATLVANNAMLTGDVLVEAAGTGHVDLRSGSRLDGTVNGGNVSLDNTSLWMLTGNSTLDTLTNAGVVGFANRLDDSAPHGTLTVRNLVGNNGVVRLNTYLGGDGAQSDRIIVDGGAATGTTRLAISNVGGLGSYTYGNGIQVVDAQNGGVTAGAFVLNAPVAVGAYDYTLVHGAKDGSAGESWYLTSEVPAPAPVGPNYRAEVPLYTAGGAMPLAYGQMLLDGLHKRVGEQMDLAGRASDSAFANGAWGRMVGQRGDVNGSGAQGSGPDYTYDLYMMQAGMDVFRNTSASGARNHAGFYVATGQMDAIVSGENGARAGQSTMNAYTLGGYWTHYGATGWYVDAVLQGTMFDTEMVSARGVGNTDTNGSSLAASLEVGYPVRLGDRLTLEPQAQIVWQNTWTDDATSHDENGNATSIEYGSGVSVAGRVGARLASSWQIAPASGSEPAKMLTAWVSPNLWHEFRGDTHTTLSAPGVADSGVRFNSDLGGTWGEVNVGVNAQINAKTSLIANAGYSFGFGNLDRSAYEGRVGLRVNW